MAVVALIPLWILVLANTVADRFTVLALGSLSLTTLLFVPIVVAVFMRSLLKIHLDDHSVIMDSLNSQFTRRMEFSEIKGDRGKQEPANVSPGFFRQGIVLPNWLILDRPTRKRVDDFLRKHLDDAHLLLRVVR